VVSIPPDADAESVALLRSLPGLILVDDGWETGRFSALNAALATDAGFIHYVDCDRLVRWVETRPDELRRTVEAITRTDCLVIGRTPDAFATHPRALQDTERLSNRVFSSLLGRPLDFSAGSKGFSRAAAEFLRTACVPSGVMGTDSEWIVLLHRAGYRIDACEVDGLDWETADRYLDHAADPETQRRAAAEYDADSKHWAFRVAVAQEIVEAGFAALARPLAEEKTT
jgi:hypothetical protein